MLSWPVGLQAGSESERHVDACGFASRWYKRLCCCARSMVQAEQGNLFNPPLSRVSSRYSSPPTTPPHFNQPKSPTTTVRHVYHVLCPLQRCQLQQLESQDLLSHNCLLGQVDRLQDDELPRAPCPHPRAPDPDCP